MERRVRVQAIVLRGDQILMTEVQGPGQHWFCLPGGGLETGETPEQCVLRELHEECSVQGRILRQTGRMVFAPGDETVTFLVDIQDQDPVLGFDPEDQAKGISPTMVGLRWMRLDEVPERDRAFLWAAGLLAAGDFWKTVEGWGADLSYPGH